MLLKTLAVALMLFVGMTARQVAQHRLARATDLTQSTAFQLRRAFGTEVAIGIVVLALSGALLSFTPDKVAVAETVEWAIEKRITDPASGLELVVRLEPGRVGTNRLQVEVVSPETGVSGLTVTFIGPAGSTANTMSQPIALTGTGIADTASGDELWGLPFDVAGAWTLQVDATTAAGCTEQRHQHVRDPPGGRLVARLGDRAHPERGAGHRRNDDRRALHDGGELDDDLDDRSAVVRRDGGCRILTVAVRDGSTRRGERR